MLGCPGAGGTDWSAAPKPFPTSPTLQVPPLGGFPVEGSPGRVLVEEQPGQNLEVGGCMECHQTFGVL